MNTRITLVSMTIILLISCGTPPTTEQAATQLNATSEKELTESISARLNQVFVDYNKASLELNPIMALFQGNMDYNHIFGDYLSDEYLAKSKALAKTYLGKVKAFDSSQLNDKDYVSYEIFVYDMEQEIRGHDNGSDQTEILMPINQFSSWIQYLPLLGSGNMVQPFKTVQDYDDWKQRISGLKKFSDDAIMRMREGIKKGVVLPKELAEKTLPQLQSQVVSSAQESVYYTPIKNLPVDFSKEDKARITSEYTKLISELIIPAYQQLANFWQNEYLPNTRSTHGIGGVTGGDVYYQQAIEEMTTTNMTAEEIHQLGLAEATKLYSEMQKVKDQVNFEGSMPEFFEFLKNEPSFYYTAADNLMQGYEDLRSVINPKLDTLFKAQPKTDYVLREVEAFRAPTMAAAQYFPGAADGSRPGIFYVNTYDLGARPKWMMEALSIHEASPGHHFQISINQETGNLPPFRQYASYNAYSEGWGLYSETLGLEMQMYQDPYQYFGMLYAQIWRANRLVVDTGLHAKGWTREQAIEFMKSNSPAPETDVIAEVERYMAIPGQALGYMIGRMKLQELRANAKDKLGDKFDVREFHHQILKDGGMPLSVLEKKINRWVENQG